MTFDMVLFVLIVLTFPFTQSQSIDFYKEKPQNVFNIRDSLVINTFMTSNLTLLSTLLLNGKNAELLEQKNVSPSTKREYFYIISKLPSGWRKSLAASTTKVGEVVVWDGTNKDHYMWFWDGVDQNILRNKKYPERVIK